MGAANNFDGYSCFLGDESGPDHLYVLTTATTVNLGATLSGLDADLDVFILSAPSPVACLAYGDMAANILGAPPGVYYIVVDGFGGAAGSYTLAITCATPTATPTATTTQTRTPTATTRPRIYFPIIMKELSPVF